MLGKLGDARAVEPLILALGDEDSNLRRAAALALAKAGEPVVEPLVQALGDRRSKVRREAADGLLTQVQQETDAPRLRSAARRLWWRLTEEEDVANAAFEALERTVARLTELEVEALGGEPDPFAPEPPKAGPSPALLVALSVLVAAISGIASNILAAYLQVQYELITDPARIAIVVAVFVLTLAGSIWLALRLNRGATGAAQ
jgi:HEAT repeat protein